jgi:cleavage and polyadenylation specificity factor subunit 5
MDGLKRKLNKKLSPIGVTKEWTPLDLISEWTRPDFNARVYPYCPAHVSRPKEIIKVYVVPLPDSCAFAVPRNMRLIAVPLCDLHSNVDRFGSIIASLPLQLSRFQTLLY